MSEIGGGKTLRLQLGVGAVGAVWLAEPLEQELARLAVALAFMKWLREPAEMPRRGSPAESVDVELDVLRLQIQRRKDLQRCRE